MGKKIIIIQNQLRYRKIFEEDINKVYYLAPKATPKIPNFQFKTRRTNSDVSTDSEIEV